MAHFPRARWKRNVTFSFDGVMGKRVQLNLSLTNKSLFLKISVAFGGTLSLFLGCSFVSLAEIVYFIVIHFIHGCKKHLRHHHKSNKRPRKFQFKKFLIFRRDRTKNTMNGDNNNNIQLPYIN